MIPLLLITSSSPAKEYFLTTLLRETALGMAGGFLVGTLARLAWHAAEKRGWIDKESRLVWTISLAMFTTGLASRDETKRRRQS
jgi:NhaP-type Na+/H+ or K+/H+ antiporter